MKMYSIDNSRSMELKKKLTAFIFRKGNYTTNAELYRPASNADDKIIAGLLANINNLIGNYTNIKLD